MQVGKCKKDIPPKCSGGFAACLLIRARAIFFSQEKRQLLCQKQNKGHSGHCRLQFVPIPRHVVSLSCAATQGSNGQHWDLLSFSTVLSKVLPLLCGHDRMEQDLSIALTLQWILTVTIRTVPNAVG